MGYTPLWLDVLVFGSLLLLGVGYFWKDKRGHLFRVVGFVGFGIFWGVRAAIFVAEGSDAINITFTALALPFFAYLGLHEWMSFKKDLELPALRWATGATFLGGILYFSVDRIPMVAGALIEVVAHQSLWMLNLFYSRGFFVEPIVVLNGELSAPISGSGVAIILGCTSFEAIVIFLGAIFAAQMRKDPWADYGNVKEEKVAKLRAMTPQRRQMLGLLYTIPVIWALNLVRNASVIYIFHSHSLDAMAASLGYTGPNGPFDFAHGALGKGLSFVALIVIAFVLFKTCPEILDNVNGLMDLPRRGKKGGKGGTAGKTDPGADENEPDAKGLSAPAAGDPAVATGD